MRSKTRGAPSYLSCRHGRYYARIPIPLKLRPRIPLTIIKYSLQTGDIRLARHRCRLVVGRVHTIFRNIENGGCATMRPDQIRSLIKKHIQQLLDDDMDYRVNMRGPVEPLINPIDGYDQTIDAEQLILDELKEKALSQLVRSDYSDVSETVREMLASAAPEVDSSTVSDDDFNLLCHTFLRMLGPYYDVLKERAEGVFKNHDAESVVSSEERPQETQRGAAAAQQQTPVNSQPAPSPIPGQASRTLEDVIQDHWEDRSPSWKPRTATEYDGARQHLLEHIAPHTPVQSINYETMKTYRQVLQDEGLSIGRINFYLGFAGQVFNYEMKTSGLLRINPASGLKLKDRRRKDTLRGTFSIDDLTALFVDGMGYRKDKFKQTSMFWAPLISLYSGCRLEECSQLYADQIREVGGTMCMVIDEEHEDQSVKTAEKREVPLHPFLLDLGLHRYAQGLPAGSRLWPELKRVGNRYGHYLGRRFGDYKKACGVGKKVTFHSFRGTVETELREQDVDPTWIDILTGHSVAGEGGGRYLQRKPSVILEKAVSKLTWEQQIDLSHLFKSKHARPAQ